ncbi:hypothetical protein Tco_0001315 [Tanacetum coccineum]
MAASAIVVSSDSSDESVGSSPSRVILFGAIHAIIPTIPSETPVISSVAPVVETTIVVSPTGLCDLVPYSDFDSDSPDNMASLEHISSLPATSPFLCTDSLETPYSSDGPPSQDPYVIVDIPIGRLYRTHPGGPCRALTARKSVRPLSSHYLALRHTSHHLDCFTSGSSSGHSSSEHSSSGHSI